MTNGTRSHLNIHIGDGWSSRNEIVDCYKALHSIVGGVTEEFQNKGIDFCNSETSVFEQMEDSEVGNKFGGSLPVENVQQLASTNLENIPHRYIRPEINPEDVISTDESSSQIPVIDMSKLASDSSDYAQEMAKLHQACEEWGFFQLTNHGAAREIENMKAAAQDFFKLPLEEKMVYAQIPGGLEGYGQCFVTSEDQKLDWSDMFAVYTLPTIARNMSFWPNNPTSFRSNLADYSRELDRICISLYESMATNLGCDFKEFMDMHQEMTQAIRMNYYPPCPQADKVVGFTPHSDGSQLTLLVQVNEVEGLQICNNGKWIPVKPLPGAIIVNIGDAMEVSLF
ncbi:OLC1v1031419C1 [Oldenlandia corymbosa var. corymbosa]|uniref:OLC1v1031419C1 n=1 Tax=Oldenlandia corymbosa var. corymbosa TaxID=529605 RepID=A0AAV1CK30_OLDCO|nr:OLC1v1031419C1 [Oldenlandia corymbosa var. corymbosa]